MGVCGDLVVGVGSNVCRTRRHVTPFAYEETEFAELDYFESHEELEEPLEELPEDGEGLRDAVLQMLAVIGLTSEEILALDDDDDAPSYTLLLEAWDYDLVYRLYAIPDEALTEEMKRAIFGLNGSYFNFSDCVGESHEIMPDALRVLSATGLLDSAEDIIDAIEDYDYPEPDALPSVSELEALENTFDNYLVGSIEDEDDAWKLENVKLLNGKVSGFSMYRRMDSW